MIESGSGNEVSHALLLALPADDIASAAHCCSTRGMTLLPAGGVGDLEGCPIDAPVFLVEIGTDGISAAARWNARLTNSLTLAEPDPRDLLPTTWVERHPAGWQARAGQVFIPVSELAELPKHEWLFPNELVPKGAREGRRFAPRVPVLIRLPD